MPAAAKLLRARWPEIRAALIALHVVALVVLSLPRGSIANRAAWRSPNNQDDFATWARRLNELGVDTTPARLEARLWSLAQSYLAVRTRLGAPFAPYAEYLGVVQGWNMFASPQRFPGEIHVDVLEPRAQAGNGGAGAAWRAVYRPRSAAHPWRRGQLDHTRARKLMGNTVRKARTKYDELARWLATAAARDCPQATRVLVRVYRYRSLPPERVRAGERPRGTYEQARVFDAAELR